LHPELLQKPSNIGLYEKMVVVGLNLFFAGSQIWWLIEA
jgi:hypothetical protein